MKRHLPALFALLFGTFLVANAQTRFIDEVFESVVVTEGVVYGNNVSILPIVLGQSETPLPEDLVMDIYEPDGDTLSERPLVIVGHRGDFLPPIINQSPYGTRKDSAVVEMCKRFAKKGYVAVSMDFRLGWNPLGSSLEKRAPFFRLFIALSRI